jgi:hypothetical protein
MPLIVSVFNDKKQAENLVSKDAADAGFKSKK